MTAENFRLDDMPDEFALGDLSINAALNRIDCRGRSQLLEPKVMRLLVCLAARQGRVVSRPELFDIVWLRAHVVEGVLPRAIYQLRIALNKVESRSVDVETVRQSGYRIRVVAQRAQSAVRTGGISVPPALSWSISAIAVVLTLGLVLPQELGSRSEVTGEAALTAAGDASPEIAAPEPLVATMREGRRNEMPTVGRTPDSAAPPEQGGAAKTGKFADEYAEIRKAKASVAIERRRALEREMLERRRELLRERAQHYRDLANGYRTDQAGHSGPASPPSPPAPTQNPQLPDLAVGDLPAS